MSTSLLLIHEMQHETNQPQTVDSAITELVLELDNDQEYAVSLAARAGALEGAESPRYPFKTCFSLTYTVEGFAPRDGAAQYIGRASAAPVTVAWNITLRNACNVSFEFTPLYEVVLARADGNTTTLAGIPAAQTAVAPALAPGAYELRFTPYSPALRLPTRTQRLRVLACGDRIPSAPYEECDGSPDCLPNCSCATALGWYPQDGGNNNNDESSSSQDNDNSDNSSSNDSSDDNNSNTNTPMCITHCGDGIVAGSEECDGGPACRSDCTCRRGYRATEPVSTGCVRAGMSGAARTAAICVPVVVAAAAAVPLIVLLVRARRRRGERDGEGGVAMGAHGPALTAVLTDGAEEPLRLGDTVGRGSFGTVYRGTLGREARAVAVKEMALRSPEACQEVEKEVGIMQALDSPYIVRVLGSVAAAHVRYIVMEYMPLGSLVGVLASTRLSPAIRVRFALDVARGMEYLHHHKVIHRDLKPGNVLVCSLTISDPVLCKFVVPSSTLCFAFITCFFSLPCTESPTLESPGSQHQTQQTP